MGNKVSKNVAQAFGANIIIFFILLGILFFFIYPNYTEVEEKKKNLKIDVEKYEKIKKSGINFETLKKEINDEIKKISNNKKEISKKEKLEKILFMKNYLDNLKKENKENDFLVFLEKKQVELENLENNENIINLEKNIENILPSYVENDENLSNLNDLKFVNYLEKLFYAFNLKNDTEIGIGNIVALDTNQKVKKINLNQDQIFYIPIKLNLSGKKTNIIKFLYFLENVGKIKISEKNINKDNKKLNNKEEKDKNKKTSKKKKLLTINFYKDNVLNQEEANMGEENIYANMLSTIDSIKMQEYIDSKLEKTKNIITEKDFISYIEKTQNDEEYKVSLELRFYIKGLPKYKLREYILSLIKDYNTTTKKIDNNLKKLEKEIFNGTNPLLISKLENLKKFLDSKQKEILRIKKSLNKEKNLVGVYNKLKEVETKLEQAKKIMEKLNNKS